MPINQLSEFLIGFSIGLSVIGSPSALADPPLYETGPGQDSSYVRFLNATDADATVSASNGSAKIALTTGLDGRVSRFFPINAKSKQTATIQIHGQKIPVEVVAKPGEYITVVAISMDSNRYKVNLVREIPTDYNAMRSSLSLSNLDAKCGNASMSGGKTNVLILDDVKPFGVQRRLVNPVTLAVQIDCDGQSAGAPVDLSQLEAGERYSVFLLTLKNGRLTFFVRDTIS